VLVELVVEVVVLLRESVVELVVVVLEVGVVVIPFEDAGTVVVVVVSH